MPAPTTDRTAGSSADPGGDTIPGLAALVVKRGVGVGGLTDAARALALGFVWTGLPRAEQNERQVNDALKAQLAGAASCLQTDHVELRRWLCDAGWLARDGYGRVYRRVPVAGLPEPLRALGDRLETAFPHGDTAAWAQAQRDAIAAARAARREAHAGAHGPAR